MKLLKFIIKSTIVVGIILTAITCSISYGSEILSIENIDAYILKSTLCSEDFNKLLLKYNISSDPNIVSEDIKVKPDLIATKQMMIKPKLASANSDPSKGDIYFKYFRENDIVNVEISSVDNGYSNIIISNDRYAIESKFLKEVESIDKKYNGRMKYAGKFQLTAYAWTGNKCANGKYPSLHKTVAAHKSDFPMGTRLYIENYGYYIVEDRGGFHRGVIDIYLGEHNACVKFGRKHGVNVYVVK